MSCEHPLGMTIDWVDRKHDIRKNVVEMNLTPEPAPTGEIWHLNPSGLRSSSGGYRVVNVFLLRLFQVYIGFFFVFWVFSGSFWIFLVSGFSGSFHFFGFQAFFGSFWLF
jgi:hypothetical protein